MRGEIAGSGVHVLTVYPGPIQTYLGQAAKDALEDTFWVRMAPFGSAQTLARMIRMAVERRRPRIVYPFVFALSRWVPWLARWVADFTAPAPLRLTPLQKKQPPSRP